MILDVPDLAAQIPARGPHSALIPPERPTPDPQTGNAPNTQPAGATRSTTTPHLQHAAAPHPAPPNHPAQSPARGHHYAKAPREPPSSDHEAGNAAETQLAGAGRLIQLAGLHLADDIPRAVESRLVSLATVPDIADAGSDDTPPGTWLLRHIPWTEAETRISALAASHAVAHLLQVAPAAACLCVERRTWRRAEGVTHVRQIFPGDAYDLVARFGPSGGQEG